MLTEEIKKLSSPKKWLLFNDLWDELCQSPDNIEISEEQKMILDERYQEFLKNPKEGLSWEEVKSKILKVL
ncbi:MAG: addiction module protein [Candidatus Anammoxibacter sp.]